MKTLQINIAVASIFLMTSFAVNAQTNTTKSTSVKQRTAEKKQIELSKEIPTTKQTVSVTKATPSTTSTSVKTGRASEYLSMEKKIIEWSIAGEIPESFPKHIEGQTKDQYMKIVKDWSKNNLDLIKKEYHTRVLSKTSNTK